MMRATTESHRQVLALAPRQQQDREDRYFIDAFAELARGLCPRPQPRHLFDDALSKGRSYWRQLITAHVAVIDSGQDLTQALSFARALDGWVRMRVAKRDGVVRASLPAAIRDMAWIDAAGDVARMHAAVDLSPTNKRQLLESIDREVAALKLLRAHVAHELAAREVA